MKVEVLFEDNYLVIVNKPNNVLVHNSYYARNIKDATLLHLLKEQLNIVLYPIHRLDRKTSGVLVLAKQKEHVAQFQELFNSNTIKKSYLAIVRGFVEEKLEITTPVKNPDTKVYKDAATSCKPIETIELDIAVHPYKFSRYSLVELIPKTGRMHQLRIHMNKISRPIVGDYKYGDRFHNRMFENEFACKNIFLHANSIQFKHPVLETTISVNATLPDDWNKIIELFNWKN
ncbi:pseudouridine synthase [Lutibacter sp. A64]|uniref:pseudouridine synthase n=1 Tax=Lutibacter sp. A64 TaxID=2918526 RepID=UPI001F051F48|nr:pseudouridine synthase [Lutibacter sp. A64]UMB54663.1 pseudouridine synthase [Lutibacter sp. A64]